MSAKLKLKNICTIAGAASLAFLVGGVAIADDISKDKFEEKIAIPAKEVPAQQPVAKEDCDGYKVGVHAGLANFFFDKESTRPAPGLYVDTSRDCYPLNLRLGVEGRHMDLEQSIAAADAEFPGKTTEITFLRIPLSIEYMHPVSEEITWFAGLGPDLIRTANDVSDTTVGFHLSSRLFYNITESFGVGVEAGYLWAEVDGRAGDIELDSAFVTPTLGITF